MKINQNISEIVFEYLLKIRKINEDRLFATEQFLKNDTLYTELNRQINSLNFKIGKAKSNKDTTTELEKEKSILEKNLANRLKQLNLTTQDLSIRYNCKKCKDTGISHGNYCSCFFRIYNKYFLEELCITEKNIKTFKDNTLPKDNVLQPLIKQFIDYTKNFKQNKSNYLFFGKTGAGKTFLAECIASELKKQFDVLYLSTFELNNLFTKIHTAPLVEKKFYYTAILDCDLIIIDDLGTEPIYKNVTKEYLYLLLNERIKRGKPFIITTNLNPKEILMRYGDRIFSRIFTENTKTLEFPNQNLRI